MNETKKKGLTTELQCQLYFTQLGYNVSIPLGEDCRYDMIVDFDGILKRIQIKTCRENKGNIKIATRSTQVNSKRNLTIKYTNKQIDYYATFYNNQCYMIKALEESAEISLLFDGRSTHNGFIPRYLSDYEAEKQINKIKSGNEDVLKKYKVIQYDLSGNEISTYDSIHEAARFLGKKNGDSNITNAINNKHKTAQGYKWDMIIMDVESTT